RRSETVKKKIVSASNVWKAAVDTNQQFLQWVDEHQTQVALGVGLAAGGAAIALTAGAAAPLVTPLMAAGWAALGAGGAVGLGTVGLNAYFDRSLYYGVVRNIGTTAAAAASTAFLPTMYGYGTQTVGTTFRIAITWLPWIIDKLGNPTITKWAGTTAEVLPKYIVPTIGGLFAGTMSLGMTTSIAGMSQNIDPTLSSQEQEKGQELGLSGFALTAGSYFAGEISRFANGVLIRSLRSRPYDPALGNTTLGQNEYLPRYVTSRETNTLFGDPNYTWDGTNIPFVDRAYANNDIFTLPTPLGKIDESRRFIEELMRLNELYQKHGIRPNIIDGLGNNIDWMKILNILP
ncbi:MAG: hypothetical protein ISR58_15940, partial [Anaerolineales bacterium]|nr:hypothetical protein [Anaerolineales bacterium]